MPLLDTNANVAVGAIGSFFILLAYILVSFRKELGPLGVTADSPAYQTFNLIGGAFAAASAFLTENPGSYPLGVLESIWAAIAAAALLRMACGGLLGGKVTTTGTTTGHGHKGQEADGAAKPVAEAAAGGTKEEQVHVQVPVAAPPATAVAAA